ncbi:MAG: glycosyltransferase [Bacteroidales bacterium]
MKSIYITVTNDLATDQRMHKTALNLSENGFQVSLIGRKMPNSGIIKRPYSTKRLRFLCKQGFLFYACYNVRMFFFLLFRTWDVVLACDMDTLPAGWAASRIRGKKLVFDSHELFSEVPELQNRKFVRKVWQKLESWLIPKVDAAYTVSDSIAGYYKSKHGVEFSVIRNLPFKTQKIQDKPPVLPEKDFIIYQGSFNTGRGIEKLINAMKYLPDLDLLLAGTGPLEKSIRKKCEALSYKDRINIPGRLDFDKLAAITVNASIGVSLEADMGLNYRYALPNKLFDYMRAGVPVLVSDLPEMRTFVEAANIGRWVAPDAEAEKLAAEISLMYRDKEKLDIYRQNAKETLKNYNWESESLKQLEVFRAI